MIDAHAGCGLPFISCIMPTRNRRMFVAQAIQYFQAQDYPAKELIIIDDGDEAIADLIPASTNIRSIAISEPCSIGMKRNIAVSLSQGEIICHWDDDDYYGPQRLSKQAEPLRQGNAEMSAMRMSLLLDVKAFALWTCNDHLHRQLFKQDVHYGTLMYQASWWWQGTHFASVNVGEDRRFVHALLAQDARLARIVDPSSYMYVLHGGNTTSDMRRVHPDGWERVPIEHSIPEPERAFYLSLHQQQRVVGLTI